MAQTEYFQTEISGSYLPLSWLAIFPIAEHGTILHPVIQSIF